MRDAAERAEEEEARRHESKKKHRSDSDHDYDKSGDLNENNKGSKLLEKMGWKKGEGIGRQNVLTAPIEVEIRNDRAGLGLHSESGITANDSYQDAVKKRARSR